MLYLYAIVDALASADSIKGIESEPLEVFLVETLSVIAGGVATRPIPTAENLATQDRVVRALHERADALLPMRFGAAFPTVADVSRAVRTYAAGLRERLDTVRHREQMTIRILRGERADTPPLGPLTGAEYLNRRARPPEIASLLDGLRPAVHATRVERGRTPAVVATVYHLIGRGNSEEYRAAVTIAEPELRELKVHVSGPSPCYAFASPI